METWRGDDICVKIQYIIYLKCCLYKIAITNKSVHIFIYIILIFHIRIYIYSATHWASLKRILSYYLELNAETVALEFILFSFAYS